MPRAATVPMNFFDLPIDQQIALAEQVARAAIGSWDFPATAELTLLKHRENSVFRVTHPDTGTRAVLRVHRTGYQTARSVRSELRWMEALNAFGVRTPAAWRTRDGAFVREVAVPALPEPRLCDMLEWIDGQPLAEDDLVAAFRILGELHARCHAHVRQWTLPADFERQAWDEAALLDGHHPIIAPAWENWALRDDQRAVVLACRAALRARLQQWGKGPDRYGLIHADLMPENLIAAPDGLRLIDFDDCGFGWYLYDPASALLFYYGQDFYPDLVRSWTAGYRSVRPLSDEDVDELPTFLMLRCFYGLGWLHERRNSEAAQMFNEPLVALTEAVGAAFLQRHGA